MFVQIKGILAAVKSSVITLNSFLSSLALAPISAALWPFIASASSLSVLNIPNESSTKRTLGFCPAALAFLTASITLDAKFGN